MAMDAKERAELEELFWQGCVSTRMVAALSGISRSRLGRWDRAGVLAASYPSSRPGQSRFYTWLECCKARAAAKLLARRVRLRDVARTLDRIDAEAPQWERAMVQPVRGRQLAPGDGAAGSEVITALRLRAAGCSADDERKLIADVLGEMLAEGPLGELSRYGDHITIHPLWLANYPVLAGTRLETALIAVMCGKRFQSVREVADEYGLTVEQVERAVEFEKALAA